MNQQIEERLRSALRAEADGVRLSPDPWQQNQRRVAVAASGRGRRVLAVAAVFLAVTTVAGGVALLGGGGPGDSPASGTGDSMSDVFSTENLLGPPVEAEMLTVAGQQTSHTIALSDVTGGGPILCDQYEQVVAEGADSPDSSSGSGGCTPRDPAADDDEVAFDWLMGTEGSGNIRGVTAGVDSRVSTVRIWMDNGDMVLATLHPTGWDDTRMFALTTQPPDAPIAQRLVAYGRDGDVLQAVDLAARFGNDWLPKRSACRGDGSVEGVWPIPGSGGPDDVVVALGTTDSEVNAASVPPVCLSSLSPKAIAGLTGISDLKVAVLAPEVDLVRVVDRDRTLQESVVGPAQGSPWKVHIVRGLSDDVLARAELVALDVHGTELDRQFLSRPRSP